ncbi:ATP-dependent RNA helicase RhlE [Halioglobus sp. HI00S01]|uniref:DEAD/DEAH box helicase n=1 Tax=Halioglobus sp. HI00S01 TaxID=1822214 RepID=UPI0007C24453|nr:DEAD/DEAH box helicase [Halioglobus sp. HI00S01]KZX60335.1 ATP-dependent RNA helicase RhlE [Halioglobus sp. HI00S01]
MSFEQLGLSPALLQAVQEKGYSKPSPIQAQAIPAVLSGRDVMAAAQTGTGKTAGFTLPLLHRLHDTAPVHPHRLRALVLTPTRELAAQVGDSVETYGAHLPLKSAVVFGGVKINPQIAKLRRGIDILVATPGRLLDLHGQGEVDFSELEILVLDEADRMLDMGFIHDIRRILKLLPAKRQNLLFSATFAPEIRELTGSILSNPVEVEVNPANATADTVEQWIYPVDKKRKSALLRELVENHNWQQVLVFTRTKHGANRLAQQLDKAGLEAAAIHGNKSQGARTRALEGFKRGKVRVLVATDIAARGLDIAQLPQVVNFDLPNVPEDYVHRIGRTGRAGAAGKAYSLVSADEIKQLNGIQQLIQRHITREYVDGFEPEHEVPENAPLRRAHKPGKHAGKSKGGPQRAAGAGARNEGNQRPRRRRRARAGGGGRNSSGNR